MPFPLNRLSLESVALGMTDLIDPREAVKTAHPAPTIGGTPGSHWLACACGFYITAKSSVRACRRSFKHHRINEYAKAMAAWQAEQRAS